MKTKLKEKISEYVVAELNRTSKVIEEIEKKFKQNYFNAFEWNSEQLFKSKYKEKQLQGFLKFITEQPERTLEWLEHNVKTIQERLMRGDLQGRSTSIFANLVHVFEREADCELAGFYNTYIKWIKNDKMEI